MGKGKSHRVKAGTEEAIGDAPPRTSRGKPRRVAKNEGAKGIRMEQYTALERVDARRILSQAEQLAAILRSSEESEHQGRQRVSQPAFSSRSEEEQ